MDLEPKIYKTVSFVRHGQYVGSPERLTKLGRAQALRTAKVLAPLTPRKLSSSTMPRATETAQIIAAILKIKNREFKQFCEERNPSHQADRGFKTIFRTPRSGTSHEIVVAHGNVIRYWVCKALQIDSRKWRSMDVMQCSITTLRISSKGEIVLLGFSDVGHLPHRWRTYL